MLLRCLTAAALVSVSLPAMAAETRFECKVLNRSNTYFQPQTIHLRLDEDSGRLRVEDDLTRISSVVAVEGEVETRNAARLTVLWAAKDIPPDPRIYSTIFTRVNLRQRLTINANGTGTLTAFAPGNRLAGKYRATVACTSKGK